MNTRRPDLDWLRVIAFGLLIFYHSGMPWSGWHFHLNSTETIVWLQQGMLFLNRWRMPLVFVVSGGAIGLALGQRTAGAFALDRLRRLFVPLVFGMLVIVPPQVYAERHYYGQFAGSYLAWLPQAFVGIYSHGGNLSWHHLWFLAYVLILTFVLLPYFLWARSPSGQAVQAHVARAMGRFGLHWLMVLPLAASLFWLAPLSRNINGLVGDWNGLAYNGVLLIYGSFLFGTPGMLAMLNRQRWLSLAVGIAACATLYVLFEHTRLGNHTTYSLLSAVNTLAWLFTVIGLANHYLTMRPAFLKSATEAVLPFYMLHQTVTVIAVYWVLTLALPPVEGFAVTVLATFGITWALYVCIVRPLPWLRPLFGMKAGSLRVPMAVL